MKTSINAKLNEADTQTCQAQDALLLMLVKQSKISKSEQILHGNISFIINVSTGYFTSSRLCFKS